MATQWLLCYDIRKRGNLRFPGMFTVIRAEKHVLRARSTEGEAMVYKREWHIYEVRADGRCGYHSTNKEQSVLESFESGTHGRNRSFAIILIYS